MPVPIHTSPTESETEGLPFGVYFLSFAAGLLIVLLGMKSVLQDYHQLYQLTHLDQLYRPVPAKWLQVQARRDTSGARNDYYPDVLFEYFVDGQSVWGWRLSLEEEARPEAYWRDRLSRYRKGDTVTAYVLPGNPKNSFVEKKTDGLFRPVLKAMLGVGFVLAGLFLTLLPLIAWLRKPWRKMGRG